MSGVVLESDDHDRDRDDDDDHDDDDDDNRSSRRRRHDNEHTAVALEEPDTAVAPDADTSAIHDDADHIDDVNALPTSDANANRGENSSAASVRRVTVETSASFVKRLAFQFVLLLAAGVFYMLMFAGPGIGFGADVSFIFYPFFFFFFFFFHALFYFFFFFRS
jgi:hypothetical protein